MKNKLLRWISVCFCAVCVTVGMTACQDHEHAYSDAWTSDGEYHWHAATCEHTDQVRDKAAHAYGDDGVCSVCAYARTDGHAHTYADTWTSDSAYHWHAATCEHTDQVRDKAAHAYGSNGVCTVCAYVRADDHEHTYSDAWSGDASYHWHAATCGHKDQLRDKAAHTRNADGICTVCKRGLYAGMQLVPNADNASYTVSAADKTCEGELQIPAMYNGYPIVGLADHAFEGCESLTSVTFAADSHVTSIGAYAFRKCGALTTVELPDHITHIGEYAFSGCDALEMNEYRNALYLGNAGNAYLACVSAKDEGITDCTISETTKVIGESAFVGCQVLTRIEVSSSVAHIGKKAFAAGKFLNVLTVSDANAKYRSQTNCIIEKDTNVMVAGCAGSVIPTGVTEIGAYAFYGCGGLTTIEIPSSVTRIGESAFAQCHALEQIVIPGNVKRIGANAFEYCVRLESVEIRDGVEHIDEQAFYSCILLTDVRLADSVSRIGRQAFRSCVKLESIFIPAGVATIEEDAFYCCFELTVYCEAQERPSGWDQLWNGGRPTMWGRQGE